MIDCNCPYCGNTEALNSFGTLIAALNHTNVYLFKEQSHPGRCIVATKTHINELTDLTDEALAEFFLEVKKVAQALQKAYQPTKINYGMYNDKGRHLHIHLVPKYQEGFEFGEVFAMNPQRTLPADEVLAATIEKIRAQL